MLARLMVLTNSGVKNPVLDRYVLDPSWHQPIPQAVLQFSGIATRRLLAFFLEILLPFLFAGFGMVGAGILFDSAQSWDFFQNLPEAVILVPALLGLKGNLEMTLGSRLSTQANLGKMDTHADQLRLTCSNLSLVQAQAVFISLAAAICTVCYEALKTRRGKARATQFCA